MLSVEVPVISSEPDMSRFQILERGGAFVLNSLAFGFYTNILDVILCIDVLMPRAMHVREHRICEQARLREETGLL